MPRPEHPHIPEVKRWIAANPTASGRETHEWAVGEWGVDAAPALRTIANALREERASQPASVESESLTAGECPECLGYGKFWQAAVWIRGDKSIHSMAKDHHLFPADGKPTIQVSPDERNMGALGRQDCKRCFGTGYIGTPATRTPIWEEAELEQCSECLGEIEDGVCQCSVEEAEADPPEVAVPTPTDNIVDQLIEDAANDPTAIVSDDVAERVNPAPPEIVVDMDLSSMDLPDMPEFVTSNEVEL
jgi:hypothetical protein